jgi:hypothetical protein
MSRSSGCDGRSEVSTGFSWGFSLFPSLFSRHACETFSVHVTEIILQYMEVDECEVQVHDWDLLIQSYQSYCTPD